MWLMGVNISINYASVWFFPLGCYIRQSRVLQDLLNTAGGTQTSTAQFCPSGITSTQSALTSTINTEWCNGVKSTVLTPIQYNTMLGEVTKILCLECKVLWG